MFVVELRHIFCRLIDDNNKFIPLEQEIELILRVVSYIQKSYPYFKLKIIVIIIIQLNLNYNIICVIIIGMQFKSIWWESC